MSCFTELPPHFSPYMQDGRTALHLAAEEGELETAIKLIESGASLDAVDEVSMIVMCHL